MLRIASKIGATLKRNEFALSESKVFPLRAAPMVKKQNIYVNDTLL